MKNLGMTKCFSTPRICMHGADFIYHGTDRANRPLKPIAYKSLNLNQGWETLDIRHDLTTKGIQQFVADYKAALKQS